VTLSSEQAARVAKNEDARDAANHPKLLGGPVAVEVGIQSSAGEHKERNLRQIDVRRASTDVSVLPEIGQSAAAICFVLEHQCANVIGPQGPHDPKLRGTSTALARLREEGLPSLASADDRGRIHRLMR